METTTPEDRSNGRGLNLAVWLGPLVVFAGAVSYFTFFARFPLLRDFPWVNLPVVVLGLGLSVYGVRRAYADVTRGLLARALAGTAFLLSLVLTLLFAAYVFFLSYKLPEADGVLQVAQAAPDFTLLDQQGQTIQLLDLRGKKVVLAFYRGHW